MSRETPRVVIASPGLDAHDTGAKMVARALRDAGMDVIYLGIRATPPQIVTTAVEEDADVIGISNLSAAHVGICRDIQEGLDEYGVDTPILVGGSVTDDAKRQLKELGVSGIFPPGSEYSEIINTVRELASE